MNLEVAICDLKLSTQVVRGVRALTGSPSPDHALAHSCRRRPLLGPAAAAGTDHNCLNDIAC